MAVFQKTWIKCSRRKFHEVAANGQKAGSAKNASPGEVRRLLPIIMRKSENTGLFAIIYPRGIISAKMSLWQLFSLFRTIQKSVWSAERNGYTFTGYTGKKFCDFLCNLSCEI